MIHNFTIISRPTVNHLYVLSSHHTSLLSLPNKMQYSSSAARAAQSVHLVPGLDQEEMGRVAQQTLRRYTFDHVSPPRKSGRGVSIVWFRNDLRILDNEVLFKAWVSSEAVLPVYCVDPRTFASTYYFGFPKTGAPRAQFLIECLSDLKRSLMKRGLNLLIQNGKPEQIFPSLARAYGAHTIYAQKETCSEELNVERRVSENLNKFKFSKLELIWGSTMYHIADLPFGCESLPDVYTEFRKSVECKSVIRSCIKVPASLGPAPDVKDWGCIPEISSLGLQLKKVTKGMAFAGGESAGLSRVHEYIWKKDLLRTYKRTRNGMLGPDYSTKFSPWLASGSLSPRYIYEEVKRYEKQREANDSTYWVLFELKWRDYFRFLSIKQGNSLFHLGGPRNVQINWSRNQAIFDAWRDGQTGYPLVDANMKELSTTGFMSNRGRQIACSFLVRDMGIDWRMGAEWFETCLLDYDPCSNYGNWTYGAGVGNDPREDRYFSIPKQLRAVPKEKRHLPGMWYIEPIVALKFGNTKNNGTIGSSGSRRIAKEENNKWKSHHKKN